MFWGFPKAFQIEDIHIYSVPARPWKLRFSNVVSKTRCVHALPKSFQKEDIQICFSCPPPQVPIRQFHVQNSVFWCLPKGISNRRRYSHTHIYILFLHTPESPDSTSLYVKLIKARCFDVSQRHFKQKIFKYSIPAHPCKPRFANFICKTQCFDAFPKACQTEDIQIYYSWTFLKAQIRSQILCAKPGVLMLSQRCFK